MGLPMKQQPAPAHAPAETVPTPRKEEVPESAPAPAPAAGPAAPAATAAAAEPSAPANWPESLPAFDVFCNELNEIFEAALGKSGSGSVSTNFPATKCSAGYAICTADGHVHTHGAEGGALTLQGAVWPLLFALCDPAKAAEYIDKEHASNGITAVYTRAPNALTKAGGLVLSALNLAEAPAGEPWERLEAIAAAASALAGSTVGYSMGAYTKAKRGSESAWANAYALRAGGNLPGNNGVAEVADFYFQANALQMTVAQAATFAAAIANEGVSPKTGVKTEGCFEQVISMTSTMGIARDCKQKIPSVSGESGVTLMFVPEVCGIAVFSKEVDDNEVSVVGAEFARQIAAKYSLN